MLALVTTGLTACDLGSRTIPPPDPQVVVHAVLNPSLSEQVILLEESLTGKQAAASDSFDPGNPIATSGSIPISGATVQLEDEAGDIHLGTEQRVDGEPTGMYTVPITVQPGARYRLTVQALGRIVTATTVVPRATLAGAAPTVPFNRDHDTARVSIPAVEFARGYLLRVDAPISAFYVVTSDREVAITGDTRNLLADNLPRLFFPGFEQTLTVAAVDTNLYDYYRSANDPFSGVGLIDHVEGGLGVFGSAAVIERRVLGVTQDPSGDPLEDTFTRRDSAPDEYPRALHFYRESSASTTDSHEVISGYYISGPAGSPVRGPLLVTITFGGSFDVQMFAPGTTTTSAGTFRAILAGADYRINRGADTVKAYFEDLTGVVNYVREGK
jgi:hypothetical protein